MTNLERFWLDLMDGRRYIINEVYGNEARLRYRPHPREKQLFLEHGGRVPYDPAIEEWTQSFYEMCERMYPEYKAAYLERIAKNGRKARSWPLYQEGAKEREQLAAKMRSVILAHAKETQHQDRQQGEQASQQESQSQETADARAAQKESR